MRRIRKSEQGLLSLEASIAVTIFMFLMLFMYSFFVVFEVRNEMGHVLLATANSMAFDGYESNSLNGKDTVFSIFYGLYGDATNGNNDFTDHRKWYENSSVTDAYGNTTLSADFADVIKTRFIAYLAAGDDAKAEEILQRYHVVNGMNGLDFSGSYVDEGKLYLSVKYEIEYEFNVFNLGDTKFEHKVCSKIWK